MTDTPETRMARCQALVDRMVSDPLFVRGEPMTDAEITRLVAEKVMGWTWMVEVEGWAVHLVFSPLTSEADCAAVLDKMAADGWDWEVQSRAATPLYLAAFWRQGDFDDGRRFSWQADRCRAICIAALAAVGVEVGE